MWVKRASCFWRIIPWVCCKLTNIIEHHNREISQIPLRWRHNGHDSASNHQPHDCLLNRLFRRRSIITSKLRVTGLCVGNSPGTGEFPAQMASNADNVSIWWRHYCLEQQYNVLECVFQETPTMQITYQWRDLKRGIETEEFGTDTGAQESIKLFSMIFVWLE